MDTKEFSELARSQGIETEIEISAGWNEVNIKHIFGCNLKIGSDNMGSINKFLSVFFKALKSEGLLYVD